MMEMSTRLLGQAQCHAKQDGNIIPGHYNEKEITWPIFLPVPSTLGIVPPAETRNVVPFFCFSSRVFALEQRFDRVLNCSPDLKLLNCAQEQNDLINVLSAGCVGHKSIYPA